MASIAKLLIGALLRFVWERANLWYEQELLYQRNRRFLLGELNSIARTAAETNTRLAVDWSVDETEYVRIDRLTIRRARHIGRPIFGAAYQTTRADQLAQESTATTEAGELQC